MIQNKKILSSIIFTLALAAAFPVHAAILGQQSDNTGDKTGGTHLPAGTNPSGTQYHGYYGECITITPTGNPAGTVQIQLGNFAGWPQFYGYAIYVDFYASSDCSGAYLLDYGRQDSTSATGDVMAANMVYATSTQALPLNVDNCGCSTTLAGINSAFIDFFPTNAYSYPGAPNFKTNAAQTSYYAILYDSNGPTPPNQNTRIDTITPPGGSTIATSSAATFGVTGYINAADYQASTTNQWVELRYAPYVASQVATANPNNLFTVIRFPITSAGAFTFSTTSPATTAGKYILQASIKTQTSIDFFGLFSFAIPFTQHDIKNSATSTNFIAGQLNQYDIFQASTTAAVEAYLASSTVSMASCTSWTSFSLTDCLNVLFVPQPEPTYAALQNFEQGFLSYAPWGYLTRFVIIVGGTSTTSLPSFNVPIYPDGNDSHAIWTSFNMQDMIDGGGSSLNSINARGTSLNTQQILEPMVQVVLALFCLLVIVRDLTGHGKKH